MTEAKVFAEALVEAKDWRQTGVCRCCLSRGYFQAMDMQYCWDGIKENFADMLRETFQITLQELATQGVGTRPLICGACVLRLRDANAFQRQVRDAERSLFNVSIQVVEIKFEPIDEPEDKKPVIENYSKVTGARLPTSPLDAKDDEYEPPGTIPSALQKPSPKTLPKRRIKEGKYEDSSKNKQQTDKCKSKNIDTDVSLSDNSPACPQCKKVLTNLKCVRQHMRRVHEKQPELKARKRLAHDTQGDAQAAHKCNLCQKEFSTFENKQQHLRINHKLKAPCPHCPERFLTRHRSYVHQQSVHGLKETVFPCGACDKVYKNKTILRLHQRNAHMLERNHQCAKCPARFFSVNRLKNHMVRHDGPDKMHECEFCYKRFPRRNTMMYHRRIHTGDKRSVCKICGEAFVQSASLKYHMTRHHPEV